MEITTGRQDQTVANFRLQPVAHLLDARIVEGKLAARVWCRNNMSNTVSDRGFGHGQGFFQALWPVIQARQDMTVHINHAFRELPWANRGAFCSCTAFWWTGCAEQPASSW